MNDSRPWARSCALALLIAAVFVGDGVASQESSLESIMQRKLDYAHVVLEALITEDWEALAEGAANLTALSNQANWFVLNTSEYTERSAAFRRAVAEIASSAEEKNQEGAALGYVEMTLTCVKCHQSLRGARRAGILELPQGSRRLLPTGQTERTNEK